MATVDSVAVRLSCRCGSAYILLDGDSGALCPRCERDELRALIADDNSRSSGTEKEEERMEIKQSTNEERTDMAIDRMRKDAERAIERIREEIDAAEHEMRACADASAEVSDMIGPATDAVFITRFRTPQNYITPHLPGLPVSGARIDFPEFSCNVELEPRREHGEGAFLRPETSYRVMVVIARDEEAKTETE